MSELVLVLGGARSGKSTYAESLAAQCGGDDVAYLATMVADPTDPEIQRRVAGHRDRRPATWRTLEHPALTMESIGQLQEKVVLLDCLSGFVSNIVLTREDDGEEKILAAVREEVDQLLTAVGGLSSTVVVVSNEVGMGIVPAYPLGRWFRDALGEANQQVAAQADRVVYVVAGLPMALKG